MILIFIENTLYRIFSIKNLGNYDHPMNLESCTSSHAPSNSHIYPPCTASQTDRWMDRQTTLSYQYDRLINEQLNNRQAVKVKVQTISEVP